MYSCHSRIFFLFKGWIIFHFVYIPHFLHPCIHQWIFNSLHILVVVNICWTDMKVQPWLGAELVGTLAHIPKVYRFDPWSGHIPRLWVQSPVRDHKGKNWPIFLFLYVLLPLSLKSINVPSGEDLKKHESADISLIFWF